MPLAPQRVVLASFAVVAALSQPAVAQAADITVLCSNGMRAVMEDLVPQFEKSTTHRVTIRYGLSAALKRQIEAGEPFDLAVLTPALIDDLIAEGKVGGDSRVELARSRIALAIRSDALKPDLRTIDALKQTLLAARSIAYATEGAGGLFFAELVQKLGLAEPLASKGRPLTTGVDVGAAVARGDAEFGVLPLSEVLPVRGIEAIENFPAELQGYVTMVAGLRAGASPSDGARALVAFLTDTGALPVIERRGMERPR